MPRCPGVLPRLATALLLSVLVGCSSPSSTADAPTTEAPTEATFPTRGAEGSYRLQLAETAYEVEVTYSGNTIVLAAEGPCEVVELALDATAAPSASISERGCVGARWKPTPTSYACSREQRR